MDLSGIPGIGQHPGASARPHNEGLAYHLTDLCAMLSAHDVDESCTVHGSCQLGRKRAAQMSWDSNLWELLSSRNQRENEMGAGNQQPKF
eukprot:s1224_g10.t1